MFHPSADPASVQDATAFRPPAASPETRQYSVVLAEDDALMAQVLATTIEANPSLNLIGHARDGHAAIEAAISMHPDMLLLDVSMPNGGGPLAARTIASACPAIRIVAISAHEDEEHVAAMINAGAVGYILKSAPAEKIIDTLKRCAEGESIFMPSSATNVMREHAAAATIVDADRRALDGRIKRLQEICDPTSIETVFQPVVNLNDGKVLMVEALSRFPHHQRLNTGEWFEEATDLKLSAMLEIASLRSAIAAILQNNYHDSRLAINLSPATLISPDLEPIISRLPAERVTVEITEHAPVLNYTATKAALSELSVRGMKVAVDDAGAGFASLRHILALMPNLIKLDISLTRKVDLDPARRALAVALIAFAREIGAEIIAEGIETLGELICLRDLGVQYGQGYLLGRPTAMEQLDLPRASAAALAR